MKPVFIPSWTIPMKYLRSANLPIAMSQMAAMKMSWFLQKKAHSARNNDAFTYCGISLISPNTLHQQYSGTLKSFMFYFNFGFIGKVAPSLVQFSGEWPLYENHPSPETCADTNLKSHLTPPPAPPPPQKHTHHTKSRSHIPSWRCHSQTQSKKIHHVLG